MKHYVKVKNGEVVDNSLYRQDNLEQCYPGEDLSSLGFEEVELESAPSLEIYEEELPPVIEKRDGKLYHTPKKRQIPEGAEKEKIKNNIEALWEESKILEIEFAQSRIDNGNPDYKEGWEQRIIDLNNSTLDYDNLSFPQLPEALRNYRGEDL
tara:strand:- start:1991 stop:2449 length:459 start_codon:yes stop_codon:yes gene_type:complete